MRLELREVGKRFGKVVALDRISLDVPSGARVALIGANGSGKTTLLRAIMGVVAHDGEIRLDGLPAFRERARLAHRLAYVPQIAPQLAAEVGELVRTVAGVRGLPVERTWALARRFDLVPDDLRRRPFRSLSGGMKQKLLLALAFAAEASLLVLDEPTASLDAAARARFFELHAERAAGATLLLCSHRLEEIRHLVDHVIALEDGRLVYHGPLADYLAAHSTSVLELHLAGEDGPAAWALAHGFARGVGGWWSRAVYPAEKLTLLGEAVAELGPRLRDVSVREVETLEVEHAR
jgi:ABC-2 type transport system ATP-binding protein